MYTFKVSASLELPFVQTLASFCIPNIGKLLCNLLQRNKIAQPFEEQTISGLRKPGLKLLYLCAG